MQDASPSPLDSCRMHDHLGGRAMGTIGDPSDLSAERSISRSGKEIAAPDRTVAAARLAL